LRFLYLIYYEDVENSLNFVVVGTDHRFQENNLELEAILQSLAGSRFVVPLNAIAEEYSERLGSESVAQRLAKQLQIPWFNMDMTTQERSEAGILETQSNRPGMFQPDITYRIPSDDIREESWVDKLTRRLWDDDCCLRVPAFRVAGEEATRQRPRG
jgi:hypothetical protein